MVLVIASILATLLAGLAKTRVLLKTQPTCFFGWFYVFFFFIIGLFWVLLGFIKLIIFSVS